MGNIDDSFTIKTLVFCLIVYMVIVIGNAIAVSCHASQLQTEGQQSINTIQNQTNITENIKQQMIDNIQNQSKLDPLTLIGGIALGTDYPFPINFMMTIVSTLLIFVIAYNVACLVRAWIPLI
jgi:hypothetical protein